MRFVWAVIAFVLAAVMIAAGVAQRTVFEGPKTQTTNVHQEKSAPFVLIDGAVLNRMPGTQTLRVAGSGAVFAAYGRTADVKAWLADSAYNAVTVDHAGRTVTRHIAAKTPASASSDAPTPAPTTPAPTPAPTAAVTSAPTDGATSAPAAMNPDGSDLWLEQFTDKDLLIRHLQLPATMSVLVATNGSRPAPAEVSVTWPTHTSTPWAGPLIVGGGILMALGVLLYILGLRNLRRSRGPRRKAPPALPETAPIDVADEHADKGVISAGRAPARRRRRMVAVLPILAVSALVFSGCSADAWPQFAATASPTSTATVIVPPDQKPPAVTSAQAERILGRIASTVAKADKTNDADLAATRLDGAALAERQTNYTLRGKITGQAALPAIPATGLKVILPQAYDGWPRTVMLISETKSGSTATSHIMMVSQHDPWSPYRLSYIGVLDTPKLPDVAPAYVGAAAVQPDSSFLVMAPQKLAQAYADLIDNGDKSATAGSFDVTDDAFLTGVLANRKKQLAEFDQTASQTGSLAFAAVAGAQDPLALATLTSGAIVAVNVDETETVKPTNPDAVIKLDDPNHPNPTAEALTGVKESPTGFVTTYSDQLFFYVPAVASSDSKIRLIGYSSNILGAKVGS